MVAPVEFPHVGERRRIAPRFLRSGHGVVLPLHLVRRHFDPQEAVPRIDVGIESRRARSVAELHRRDDLLSVDLHHVMEVVIAARARHDVDDVALILHARETLIVVHVAGENDVGDATGLILRLVQCLFHGPASGMVIICGEYGVMHRHEQRLVLVGVAKFADQPIQLIGMNGASLRHVRVESHDCRQRRLQRPEDVRLRHGRSRALSRFGCDYADLPLAEVAHERFE